MHKACDTHTSDGIRKEIADIVIKSMHTGTVPNKIPTEWYT